MFRKLQQTSTKTKYKRKTLLHDPQNEYKALPKLLEEYMHDMKVPHRQAWVAETPLLFGVLIIVTPPCKLLC